MLIAHPAGRGFRVVDAFSRATRLGEGLSSSGVLSDAAMERTIQALSRCTEKMRRAGVSRMRAVATEACRRAANGSEFLERTAMATGLDLEIISPTEEARLALAGCAPLLDHRLPHALVFDIGGGSTELMWVRRNPGAPPSMTGVLSLPLGVVTLGELFGHLLQDLDGYDEVVDRIAQAIQPFDRQYGITAQVMRGKAQMLGTSGTVTTLGGILLGLPRYERRAVDGLFMNFDDVEQVSRALAGMSHEDRVAHPCIGRDRADLVVAGCAILAAICKVWPVGRLRVADRGLREGMLFEMMRARPLLAAE